MSSSAASQEEERAQQTPPDLLCKVGAISESSTRASSELVLDLAEENEVLKSEVQRLRAQLQQKADLETCQELQMGGPKAAAQGTNHKEIRKLLRNLAGVVFSVEALPMGLSAAEDAKKREVVRRGAAPTLHRGNGSDEAAVRRMQDDLTAERPLQSLQNLRHIAPPNMDMESGIGKVIGQMTQDVVAVIDKFKGDGPVPYAKEDGMIRDLTEKYIVNPIKELQNEEKGAEMLGKDLDAQEEELRSEIAAKSQELLGRGGKRGEKEQSRNLKVKELLEYHVKRVGIANSQNKPMEILQAKLAEFEQEAERDAEAYKSLQEYHLDEAKALRGKMEQLEKIVCEAEEDSHQEERRECLRVEVEALGKTLQQVLEKAQHLSEVCAILDGKQLAYEEAKKLQEEELPGLEMAEETHMEAHRRVVSGAELLADVVGFIKTAYAGFMEHSRAYMEECERKAPVYGAKCMAVQQTLHRGVDEQMERLHGLLEKKVKEYDVLDGELEMAEELDTDSEENQRKFKAAEKKFEECKNQIEEWREKLRELEKVKKSTSLESLQPAHEAAALADPTMQDVAQHWVNQFLYERPKQSQQPGRLPALTEGEEVNFGARRGLRQVEDHRSIHLQLEDGQRLSVPCCKASTVEEDAISVQSSCDYLMVGDTPQGAAKAGEGAPAETAVRSAAGPVAASSEGAPAEPSAQSIAGSVEASNEDAPPGAAKVAERTPAEPSAQSTAGSVEASNNAMKDTPLEVAEVAEYAPAEPSAQSIACPVEGAPAEPSAQSIAGSVEASNEGAPAEPSVQSIAHPVEASNEGAPTEPSAQSIAGPLEASNEGAPTEPSAQSAAGPLEVSNEGTPAEPSAQSTAGTAEASNEAPAIGLDQAAAEGIESPATAGEEVSADAFYMGTWKSMRHNIIATFIQDAIMWPDGSSSAVEMDTPTSLVTTFEGEWYHAKLQNGQLSWNDGDNWTKLEA